MKEWGGGCQSLRGGVGFPGGSDGTESVCNVGVLSSIPGLGQFPGEGNGCPLQYSCLENPMDRGAWQATVHGVTELDMTEWLRLSLSRGGINGELLINRHTVSIKQGEVSSGDLIQYYTYSQQ